LFFDGQKIKVGRRNVKIAREHPSVQFSIFVGDEEEPECWRKSELLVLFKENIVLGEGLFHGEFAGVGITGVSFAPDVAVSVGIEEFCILLLDGFDGIFFADSQRHDFSCQSVDYSDSAGHGSGQSYDVMVSSPPKVTFIRFLLESWRKYRNTFRILIHPIQRYVKFVKVPAQIFPGELNQQAKILEPKSSI
jgi:hypothetical protein